MPGPGSGPALKCSGQSPTCQAWRSPWSWWDSLEHRARGSSRPRPLPVGGCCRWVCLQPSRKGLALLLPLLSSVIQGTGAGSLMTNDKCSFCHRQTHRKSFQSRSMELSTSGIPLTMAFKEKSKEMLNNADQKRKSYHFENTIML